MLNPEIILQRLDWTIIRKLDGLLEGDYSSLFHGFGIDLAELREYQYSDDVRYIDWNVTARMQTPYVRQYLEDREVTAWFLLDISPSMDFGHNQTLKRELLANFTGVLARLLTRHGNRVGAILFSGKIEEVIPPGCSKNQALQIIQSSLDRRPFQHLPPTNITDLIDAALRIIRRRSLIFIVSDFFSLPGWEKPLQLLTQRHEILAAHIFDPLESELPDIGVVVMQDSETGEQLLINTHDSGFRKRFNEAALRREYGLEVTFRRLGLDILKLSTSGDLAAEILRFAMVRKQRKRVQGALNTKGPGGLDSNPFQKDYSIGNGE